MSLQVLWGEGGAGLSGYLTTGIFSVGAEQGWQHTTSSGSVIFISCPRRQLTVIDDIYSKRDRYIGTEDTMSLVYISTGPQLWLLNNAVIELFLIVARFTIDI